MKRLLAVIICTMLMLATACEQKDNKELPEEIPENNVEIEQENKTDVETENKTDVETDDTTEDIRPDGLPQGLVDLYGDCVLNPEEDNYGYIRLSFDDERETNGLYPVGVWLEEEQTTLYGLINSNGKLVAEQKYKYAYISSCGFSCVCIDNSDHEKEYYDLFGNKIEDDDIYTYINENGEECIGYFDLAYDFSEDGLAVVRDAGQNEYLVDTDGNVLGSFYEDGLAVEWDTEYNAHIIDTDGNVLGSFYYQEDTPGKLYSFWSDNDRKYGYKNEKGEVVIEPAFESVNEFYDGLAAVVLDNGNLGYINFDGEVVIETDVDAFNQMHPYNALPKCDFSDGIAKIDDGKYIDKNGNSIPNLENGFGMYKDGLIAVCDSEGKMGYADITGEIVIPCEFDLVDDFKDGLALVFTYDKFPYYNEFPYEAYGEHVNYYGYINTKGEFVIPPEYYLPFYDLQMYIVSKTAAGVIEVYKEGYNYYYNYDGTLIGKNLAVYQVPYEDEYYTLNLSEYYEAKKAK